MLYRSDDCKSIAIPYNHLSRRYRQALFLRIDADKYSQERECYGITAVPTFLFFYCGKEQERMTGCDQLLLEAKVQQYTQINQHPIDLNVEERETLEDNIEHVNSRQMDTTDSDSYEPSTSLMDEEDMVNPTLSHHSQTPIQSHPSVPAHTLGSTMTPAVSVSDLRNRRVTTLQKSDPASDLEPVPVPQPEPVEETLLKLGFSVEVINRVLHMTSTRDPALLVDLAMIIKEEEELPPNQYREVSEWELAVILKVESHW